MKRLFRVGSGIFVFSLFPIISWLLLGLTVNSKIVNVFSLTYPIQFIWGLLKSIFATGANIKGVKEKNSNSVLSGMTLGIIVGGIVFSIIAVFVDDYIGFMNMEVEIYREFALYSIISLYIQLIFGFVLEKLYFEEKDKLANIHSLAFNFLNFAVLVGTSLITKNALAIILATLIAIGIYVIGLLIWQYHKFKFDFNILSNFKYESMTICSNIFMFATYFFGLSNAFSAGEQYLIAINFVTLITDSQWDACGAISTVAKVDLSYDKFNYRQSLKHATIYILTIIASIIVLFFALFIPYKVNLKIGLIILAIQCVDFALAIFYEVFDPYVQLNFSATWNTIIVLFEKVTRFLLSTFLLTPYCTEIAQLSTSLLLISAYLFIRFKFLKVDKEGSLHRKETCVIKK